METADLRQRVERFGSLQAAHRALARSVHPAELAPVKERSRSLLIELQGLAAGGDPGAAIAADPSSLERIDRALAEQASRTLEILSGIELANLRATIPMLSRENPDEVRGLIDVLLTGDLADDKKIRTLEYLVTMLSTEERNGRRVLTRDPSHATPRLRAASVERLNSAESDFLVAERVFEEATASLLQEDDAGEIRDRVRRYKEELAGNLLVPQLLAAAISYNVAMWNRVAGEIDSSRSMEQLAEGLFAEGPAADYEGPADTASEALGSRAFARLVGAMRARVLGESDRDARAARIVSSFDLTALRGEDADAFEAESPNDAEWLMRAAVTLGLLLRHRTELEQVLTDFGIDVEELATRGTEDLVGQMTELARKRFADSNYGEAFRLSDVKTHSLASHVPRPGSTPSVSTAVTDDAASAGWSGVWGWLGRFPGGAPAAAALAILLAATTIPPLVTEEPEATGNRWAQISPFLESGRLSEREGDRFIGELGLTWDYLGTAERREVAEGIAWRFAEQGTPTVVLMDAAQQIVAQMEDGELLFVAPRPGPVLDPESEDDLGEEAP